MSHRASHWLADIPAEDLGNSAFRVLFHLCDAHNSKRPPETACFPSQELLMRATGLSNGGLNNALNAIEKAGFIRRRRQTRNADGTLGPTFYILGCDFDLLPPPAPPPSPNTGDGTVSTFGPSPSPLLGPHRLHSGGDEPVIEPGREPHAPARRAHAPARGARERPPGATDPRPGLPQKQEPTGGRSPPSNGGARPPPSDDATERIAAWINSGSYVPPSAVTNTMRDELLARGLVQEEALRALQIY